jgi:Ca2+-binding RTX toxin-like protein
VTEVKEGPGQSFHGPTEVEIEGGPGDDDLRIGHGGRIDGGPGDDVVSVGSTPIARSSYLYGGPGGDRIRGSRGGDVLAGGEGDDRLHGGRGRDELNGGNYVDPMRGPAGRDRMYGGPGDDSFEDGDGQPPRRVDADRMHGGRGDDEVSYRARRKRVVVRLWRPGGDGQRGEGDRITWMENVRGGDGNDELVGDRDANLLDGGPGLDRVAGLAGDDRLELGEGDRADGNRGDDRLIAFEPPGQFSCGTGTDTVVWAVTAENSGEGALIPPSCERLAPGAITGFPASVVISPVPDFDGDGDLVFRLLSFACCDQRLHVTEPASPYGELGSALLDSDRVTVPVPPEVEERARARPGVGVVLRAYVLGEDGGRRLVWRFQARAP